MKILIVATYFPPQNSVASLRPYSWAKWWSRAGHELTVLTTVKYKRENDLTFDCSEFKVISLPIPSLSRTSLSYGNAVENKEKGIRKVLLSFVKKYYLLFTQKTNFFSYFQKKGCFSTCRFPDIHDLWARNVIKGMPESNFDMIISTGGPYSVHRIGLAMKKKYPKIKWIIDWRDLWTCNHLFKGLKVFSLYEKYLERKFHNNADLITTVSEPLANILQNMTKTKVEVIYNGYDPDDYIKIKQKERETNTQFTIVYTGTIYRGFRDPSPLFEAVSNLKNKNLLAKNNLQIIFIGADADVIDIAEYYHVSEFYTYLGFLPREDALQLQYDADAVLFLEYNNLSVPGILTGKLFEYLYIAREIIAIGVDEFTAAGKLIIDTRTGFCFGTNVKKMEQYLLEKINNREERNNFKKDYNLINKFNRKYQAMKILELMEIHHE